MTGRTTCPRGTTTSPGGGERWPVDITEDATTSVGQRHSEQQQQSTQRHAAGAADAPSPNIHPTPPADRQHGRPATWSTDNSAEHSDPKRRPAPGRQTAPDMLGGGERCGATDPTTPAPTRQEPDDSSPQPPPTPPPCAADADCASTSMHRTATDGPHSGPQVTSPTARSTDRSGPRHPPATWPQVGVSPLAAAGT